MEVKDAIRQLDIEKKARLLTGEGFWSTRGCAEIGLSPVKLSDGPNGMRVQEKRPNHLGLGSSLPATCYPTASAVACTFDPELCEELGKHIGKEAAAFGVSMVLGPGLNVKRSPLCGRNFEYFSEDSYLSGKIAAAYVRGIQSNGVTACVKHFAVNSREYARMYCDSRVDEQTLRETYLTGFEIAVKEGGANAVMTAYNRLNGEYCYQNAYLLNTVLRGEWGFDGLVVSDWGGSHGQVQAVKAGADLEMPMCDFSAAEVIEAVKCGGLDERLVDKCVERLAEFSARSQNISREDFNREEHSDFAAKVACESLVLLKNKGGALPLKADERVAVIGDFAAKPRYQGAGSSQIVPTSLDNILGVIEKSSVKIVGYERGFDRFGERNNRLLKRALKLADRADTLVVCLGLDEDKEAEGCDRTDLNINENQIDLLKALYALGKKTVVVLFCGSAVLTDWDCYCDGLLLAHLGGQSGAQAVVSALWGRVNPSGRLAETYPSKQGDEPCADVYSISPLKSDYAEGIFVGYKYYNALKVPAKYPFGYGLSYTTFSYGNFSVSAEGVKCTVTNTGKRDGATVVQAYVKAPRPELEVSPYELKAFLKVKLKAGESRENFMPFDKYAFRVWDMDTRRFIAGGVYGVTINTDSAHALYSQEVEITEKNLPEGCEFAVPEYPKISYKEYFDSHISPDEQVFQPKNGMTADMNTVVADLSYCKGLVAKIFGLIARESRKSSDKIKANALDWLSVRSLMQFMNLNDIQAQGFLLACNGHFFKGMKKLLFKK
ncbi:MAG: glycoside hydrolase family 3 C-terminal domain-containing protein [Clostridia bacterium]|nr:glycoside hydrolase family 3 C-terminal domain-containing protein [Clostridia bacterium]